MKAEEYQKKNHELFPVLVTNNRKISKDVHLLSFEKTSPVFSPGKVVHVTTEGGLREKPYSLCSDPEDSTMSILFNVVENGELTPGLANLKVGSTLFVSKPFGSFVHGDEPGYWIAAGTGVAPFRSMLLAQQGGVSVLVHGGKYSDSFYFQDEFREKLQERYVPCCSREELPNIYHGRLTSYLLSQKTLSLNYKYYLCGSPQMVVEVRDILISKGIPYEKIIAEIYF